MFGCRACWHPESSSLTTMTEVSRNSPSSSSPIPLPSTAETTPMDQPSNPPAAKDSKIYVEAFLGGFLFSLPRIRQLCTDAFHFTDEMIDRKGPFITAQRFFDEFSPLDSPNFIPIVFAAEAAPTDWRRGYLLICRIAYVSPGEPIPNLPFDEQTERYMEKWFPREVRESPPFEDIEYVEMMHPHDVPCE